ncbi:hypothetical protein NQD34_013370 [Periophthalmus magnuspinnatus]|nr:hypothetical protein NQD34_013370 [Periophthalmus magnuspinnatus]
MVLGALVLFWFAHSLRASEQKVNVEPEVLSYPGQTVNLPCAFSDATGVQLTMVTWIYERKDGDRFNIAVFHPNFDLNYPESPLKGRVSFRSHPSKPGQPLHPDPRCPLVRRGKVRLSIRHFSQEH